MSEEATESNSYTVTIGNGDSDASFFKEEIKTIVLAVVLKDYDAQITDSFERILFISGVKYEKTEQDHNMIYIINFTNLEQIERVKPAIESSYKKNGYDVNIVISDECKTFFDQFADAEEEVAS